MVFRNEYRTRRKHIGTTLLHQLEQAGVADFRFERLAQGVVVEADAKTSLVERLGDLPVQAAKPVRRAVHDIHYFSLCFPGSGLEAYSIWGARFSLQARNTGRGKPGRQS